jgi:chromodomain-helicase-DNA-binding protein 7
VKYKNLSYFHCEWKTEEELEKGDRRISQKIKRFRQKKDVMNMFDFLDEEPYNPDYVEVDRILDVNEIEEIIEPYPTNSGTENEDKIEAKETKDDDSQNQITKTDTNEVKDSEEFTSVPKESEKIDSESNVEKIKEELETNEEKLDNDSDDKTQDNSETDLDKKETETKEEVEANEEKDKELNDIEKKEENSDKETQEVVEAPVQTRKVKHYLVKWRALAYEDSTWELEDDLDPLKVEQFWKFRKPPPKSEWKPKRRPKPADWKKIEESPVYKGDNTLREYQLEGLNWLSFCWYNRSVDD